MRDGHFFSTFLEGIINFVAILGSLKKQNK